MENENVSPFGQALAGDNMDLGQEPSYDETTPKVEETTQNNEEESTETTGKEVAPEVEEVGDSKHSSKLIAEIGEDRKKILEKFIESARKSGVAAEELKELIQGDSRIEKYAKRKFGNDYDALMEGEFDKEEKALTEEDIKKIESKAYAKAQLEIYKEQDTQLKEKQFNLFAQSSGLTSEEAEKVKEKAEILATHDDYENALSDALLLVNRDKANASKNTVKLPTGPNDKNIVSAPKEIVNDYMRGRTGLNIEQVTASAERVEKGMMSDSQGNISYELTL